MPEARRPRVNIIPDGVLAVSEKAVLREAAAGLNLIQGTYERFYRERVKKDSTDYGHHEENEKRNQCDSELEDAYDELGCKSTATDDELKNAYRSLAKKLHPDILRAQGMPEPLMARANERMARINRAWERIKKALLLLHKVKYAPLMDIALAG